MGRHVVARVDEVPPGGRLITTISNRSVGVFNLDGEFFALRNVCPHQGAPLCLGQTLAAVSADQPGIFECSGRREFVRCPWHGWEFHLATGQSWFDPAKTRVRAYDVAVASGREMLAGSTAASGSPPRGAERLAPGPYVAETYPISVEADYLVIELD